MVRVLIVDDHAVVRKGLALILSECPETFTVDEATNGDEALSMARNNNYNLVLLDISMPKKSGLETLKELKSHIPDLPVLILSMHSEELFAVRALRAGASGYLIKESVTDELVFGIRKVLSGRKYVSNTLAEILMNSILDNTSIKPHHDALSDQEGQVLRMIGSGKKSKKIGEEMSLSVKTVSTYRARILKKMQMKSNAELIQYAIRNNLTD